MEGSMTNYINTDKLKAEIEKRAKFHNDAIKACTSLNNIAITHSAGWKEDTELLTIIDSLQQEQPEVDLEKFTEKIKTFQGRYKHPEIVSIKGAMAFMARMFYQYPDAARQWYEQLPKATMDFNARKEE